MMKNLTRKIGSDEVAVKSIDIMNWLESNCDLCSESALSDKDCNIEQFLINEYAMGDKVIILPKNVAQGLVIPCHKISKK